MYPEVKIGTITGNGAAQNVSCGFIPDQVRVFNITDGNVIHNWFNGPADALATMKETAGSLATQAANGITKYAGSSTPGAEATPGFTIGTDVSVNAKVLYYVALRNGPGIN